MGAARGYAVEPCSAWRPQVALGRGLHMSQEDLPHDVRVGEACGGIRVPPRTLQQVLRTVRARFTDPFGQLPAIVTLHRAQEARAGKSAPVAAAGGA